MLIVDRVASTSTPIHNGLHFDVNNHLSEEKSCFFLKTIQIGFRDESLQVDVKKTNQYMIFFC